jgi:hypothetical protein
VHSKVSPAGRRPGRRCRAAACLPVKHLASFLQPRRRVASRLQNGGQDAAAPGPPYALMDAPPLAVFANGVAAALNELRHCPPLVLQQPVTAVVQVGVDDNYSVYKLLVIFLFLKLSSFA